MEKEVGFPEGTADGRGKGTVSARSAWTFLTNHAHVLLCIYRETRKGIRAP